MAEKVHRMLRPKDIATRLGCSRAAVYAAIKRMPHFRIGRLVRVETSVVLAWQKPSGPEHAASGACVYFMRSTTPDAIKIGFSDDVPRRLRQLRGACPGAIALAACIPGGDRETEAELHRRFARAQLHGEWFRPEPELLNYIACDAGGPS